MDGLKKALKSKSLAEVAVLSLADLCKASVYFPGEDEENPLRRLVPEIEVELKVLVLILTDHHYNYCIVPV